MNCQPLPQRTKQLDPYSNYLEKQGCTALMCVTLRAALCNSSRSTSSGFFFRQPVLSLRKHWVTTPFAGAQITQSLKKQKSHSSILHPITIIINPLPIIKFFSKVHNQCIDIYGKCMETQPQIENKTKQVIFWQKKFCP